MTDYQKMEEHAASSTRALFEKQLHSKSFTDNPDDFFPSISGIQFVTEKIGLFTLSGIVKSSLGRFDLGTAIGAVIIGHAAAKEIKRRTKANQAIEDYINSEFHLSTSN